MTNAPLFEVEPIPLIHTRAPGYYNTDPRRARISHISVSECVIHFRKSGLPFAEVMDRVDYLTTSTIGRNYPSLTNPVTKVPRISPDDVIYIFDSADSSETVRHSMLRPEQNNVPVMQLLMRKFKKPGDTVIDTFGGTFGTSKAFLLLPKHRRVIGEIPAWNACIQRHHMS